MRARIGLTAGLAVVLTLALAAPAGASFHFMKVSEVYPGTELDPDSAFVELQMTAAGQNHVAGHAIKVYSAAGTEVANVIMPTEVSSPANNSTILLGDASVTNADFPAPIGTLLARAGGAVCFPDGTPPDCVAWGNFSAPEALPGAVGDPAAPAGIPDGQSLTRSKAAGCASLLETTDDTDQSVADFALTAPSPRPNSVQPTEKPCSSGTTPNTSIASGPKPKTKKKTATFAFSSSTAGASFECALDDKPFAACSSPKEYRRIKPGKHHFAVRAVAGGITDPSPATWDWKRKKKRKR